MIIILTPDNKYELALWLRNIKPDEIRVSKIDGLTRLVIEL